MEINPIYKFMKENKLTQMDESSFVKSHSDPQKSAQIHKFMVDNKLTNLDANAFHSAYFDPSKKKEPTTQGSGQPAKPSAPSFGQKVTEKITNSASQTQVPLKTGLQAQEQKKAAEKKAKIPTSKYFEIDVEEKQDEAQAPKFADPIVVAKNSQKSKAVFNSVIGDKDVYKMPTAGESKQYASDITSGYLDYLELVSSDKSDTYKEKYKSLKSKSKADRTDQDEKFLRQVEAEAVGAFYDAKEWELSKISSEIDNLEKTAVTDDQKTQLNNLYGQYEKKRDSLIGTSSVYQQNKLQYGKIAGTEMVDEEAKLRRFEALQAGEGKTVEFFKGIGGAVVNGVLSIGQVPKVFGDLIGDTDYDWSDQMYDMVTGQKSDLDREFGAPLPQGKNMTDLPLAARLAVVGGNAIGSAGLFAAGGGLIGATTNIGKAAATFGTAFLTSESGYYQEALDAGMSPQDAALAGTYLAAQTALIESIIPDIKYFEPSAFRKSIMQGLSNGIKSGLPVKEAAKLAIKNAIKAAPESAVAYGKTGIKEAGEELLGQVGEDVGKLTLNAVGQRQYFNDTFNPESYTDAILGGFIAGGGMSVFSRPTAKSPVQEETMREIVERRPQDNLKGTASDKINKEDLSVLDDVTEIYNAMSSHSGWNVMSREEQNHALALAQQAQVMKNEQKRMNELRIPDERKDAEIKSLEDEVNEMFSMQMEQDKQKSKDAKLKAIEDDFNKSMEGEEFPVQEDERDQEIVELQKQREEKGVNELDTFLGDMKPMVPFAVERMEQGQPVAQSVKQAASKYLYKKYKELTDMKSDPNRMMTRQQIANIQKQLEQDIRTLEGTADTKAQTNDQENVQGIPSEVGVGQELVTAQPIEVTSEEAPATGGVLQAQEEVVTPQVTEEPAPKAPRKTRLAKLFETSDGEEAVPLIEQSLSESGIKVEVKDDADYNNDERIKGSQGRGSEGMFIADDGTIVLNRDKIKGEWGKTIVFHEGIHPVINIIRNTDPKRYKAIVDGLKAEAAKNKDVAKAAADIAGSKDYQERGAETIEDETVVETMARVATGDIDIDTFEPNFREKFIEFMNDIAKMLGLRPILTNSPRVEAKRLADQINKMLNEGGKLSDVVGKKNVGKFQNELAQARVTAGEVLSKERAEQKKVTEVADTFEKAVDNVLDPSSDPKNRVKRFLENAYEDLRYFFSEYSGDTGLDWYTNKVKEFDAKLKEVSDIAILRGEMSKENSLSNEDNMNLFRVVLALSSIGINPKENVKVAFSIWKTFDQNTKTFSKYQPGQVSVRTNIDDGKGGYLAPSGIIEKETNSFIDIKQTNGKVIRLKKSDLAKEFDVTYRDKNGKEQTKKGIRLFKSGPVNTTFRKGNQMVKIPNEDILDQAETDNGIKGKGWTTKGSVVVINLERIEKLLASTTTVKDAVNWLNSKHPVAELREYNPLLPDVEGGKGKINPKGERIGSYIIGEKLGAFHQNVAGTPTELTMDLWWSRTWNRYMGTLMITDEKGEPAIQETPRTDSERNIMREAAAEAANSLGLEVHELQAALWYLEQQVYKRMGAAVESYSFVDGVNQLLLKYGKTNEEIQPERYGVDSSETEKRREAAATRAANIVYGKGGEKGTAKVEQPSKPTIGQPSKGINRGSNLVKETYYESGLTEDKNDYVFFHVSSAPKASIMKGVDSTKYTSLRTAREEKGLQYGVASYYTRPEDGERMVGGEKYSVRVPKGKVYPIDSDPMGYGEKAEASVPQGTPFRGEAVKREIADMAKKDGYQMIVGEWSYSRTGKPAGEIPEFRADALVPLKPTAEKPDSFTSNAEKGMERIPFPGQQSEEAKQELENIASEVRDAMSSKKKFSGKEYELANSVYMNGQVTENKGEDNELKRDITPQEYDTMTKVLPKSMQAEAARVRGLLFGGRGQASMSIPRTSKEFSGNASETVDRIKNATSEDGATLNVDGTTYENGGLVVPAGSSNVAQEDVSSEGLYGFLKDNEENISSDIFKIGLYKFPDRPEVSYDLNIVTPREHRDVALEFARLAGQESLFDLDTFENIKTGADGKNPRKFTAQELAEIAKDLSEGKLPKIVSEEKIVDSRTKELQEEAKKYKTANAFVKAQGKPVYHGSKAAKIIEKEGFKLMPYEFRNMASAFGDGVYFATKKSGAYTLTEDEMVEAYLPANIKLKRVFDTDAFKVNTKKLVEEGYDGVELQTGTSSKNLTIFDPSIVKTKTQLIDIWNEVDNKRGEKKMIALTKREDFGTKNDREIAAYASRYLNKFGPYTKANVIQIMNMSAEEKIKLINDTFNAKVKKMMGSKEPGDYFYDQSVKSRDQVLDLVASENTKRGQPSKLNRTPTQVRQSVEDGVDSVEEAIAQGMDPQQAIDENISSQEWYGDLSDAQKEQLNEILQDEFGATASEPKQVTPVGEQIANIIDNYYKGDRQSKLDNKQILESDPKLKYIYDNIAKINKQLQEAGVITDKTDGCP